MRRLSSVRGLFAWILIFASLLLVAPFQSSVTTVNAERPRLSIAVFSDLHITASEIIGADIPTYKFKNALVDLRRLRPDLLVINGDLSMNGRPKDYDLIKELLAKEVPALPMYPTMGNHDYYHAWENPEWNDDRSKETFQSKFALDKLYYDRYVRGVHLIFLSPEQYMPRQKEIGEAAWLSPEQVAWFEKTLLASTMPTVVFLHQPLDGTVYQGFPIGTVQAKELLAIAQKHPQVFWLSSHTHISPESPTEMVERDNMIFASTGSVWRPWDRLTSYFPGARKRNGIYYHTDPLKSQSRYLNVYDDRVEILVRNHHTHSWSTVKHSVPLKPH